MNHPRNVNLPYFAYGLLKPSELAYNQLKDFVESVRRGTIAGCLYVRDGLPLLELGSNTGDVPGHIIKFRGELVAQAYDTICKFEPGKHYRWEERECISGEARVSVNVLVGRSPRKGSIAFDEDREWTGKRDPVFEHGLSVAEDIVKDSAGNPFEPAPADDFEWRRLFRLQMAYLLLWSIIERYCALAYGPELEPTEKTRTLGDDPLFAKSLAEVVDREGKVYDCRDPGCAYRLAPANPNSSLNYYYQVRCNLSHRGKGAWKDVEITRLSLIELVKIVRLILDGSYPERNSSESQES